MTTSPLDFVADGDVRTGSQSTNGAVDDLERRKTRRFNALSLAILRPINGPEFSAELVDLSEDGAGVWSSKSIQPGGGVVLLLFTRKFGVFSTEAVVVDCHSAGPSSSRLGLKFLQRLRPDMLAAALN
jgi:hypothetical protein